MPKYIADEPQIYQTHFYNDVMQMNYYLVWGDSYRRIKSFLISNHDGSPNDISNKADFTACVYILDRNGGSQIPCIVLPFEFDYSSKQLAVIAHECLHAVIAFMRIRHIPLPKDIHHSENDEENLCYNMQWLFEKVVNALLDKDKYKFQFANEKTFK